MIFNVKQDLQYKARLVAGGPLIDALDYNIYFSTVKGISMRLLHVIAHRNRLQQLNSIVGNAYVNAFTNKKVYAIAGPKFGKNLEGKMIIIVKLLYSLCTLLEHWHAHFSDSLRSLNFKPTRFNGDVWIWKST